MIHVYKNFNLLAPNFFLYNILVIKNLNHDTLSKLLNSSIDSWTEKSLKAPLFYKSFFDDPIEEKGTKINIVQTYSNIFT